MIWITNPGCSRTRPISSTSVPSSRMTSTSRPTITRACHRSPAGDSLAPQHAESPGNAGDPDGVLSATARSRERWNRRCTNRRARSWRCLTSRTDRIRTARFATRTRNCGSTGDLDAGNRNREIVRPVRTRIRAALNVCAPQPLRDPSRHTRTSQRLPLWSNTTPTLAPSVTARCLASRNRRSGRRGLAARGRIHHAGAAGADIAASATIISITRSSSTTLAPVSEDDVRMRPPGRTTSRHPSAG